MIRTVVALRRWAVGAVALAMAVVAVGLNGCISPQVRSQSDDDLEREKYDVKTVGDLTDVGNVDPIQVGGIGLVINLEGTGGSAPPGSERSMLEDNLRKNQKLLNVLLQRTGCKDVKDLLNSPDTALVRVAGLIPAGASKGDPLDVEVTVPPTSKVTSLRGGYLVETVLYNYDFARNLSPAHASSDRAFLGHPLVRAEGQLLVGFGDGDEAAKIKVGRIWGGGKANCPRSFYLVLKQDQQLARVAGAVADRINESFHGSFRGPGATEIAKASNNQYVALNVPPQYHHNLPRFLRVVRLVPMREISDKTAANDKPKVPYRKRLEEDVMDPNRAVTAALRLEALGTSSVSSLKGTLQSRHPLVRFCGAEALAYLGEPAAGEALADMVENHAVLRAFSLTAMASLDEAVCHLKLRELLQSPNPETRYGAFRALRALDENDEAIAGEHLNHSFWLHRVAPGSPSLVHVSSSKRAEIVQFGDNALLVGPFSFRAGDFTFTAGENDSTCVVSRFSPHRGRRETRQCSLQLDGVLRTLASLGGTYPEAVEFLRQANSCERLTCRVEVDRLPQAVSVYELARASTLDEELLPQDAEILEAKPDFGSTPTLYDRGLGRRLRSTVPSKPDMIPSPGIE